MGKLIFFMCFIALGLKAYDVYQDKINHGKATISWSNGSDFRSTFSNVEPSTNSNSHITIKTSKTSNFSCDGRQHCSQMRSKAEAQYFNRYCPNTKMDGDHDGIPCERHQW